MTREDDMAAALASEAKMATITLALLGEAEPAATAAVLEEAKRRQLTEVEIARAQSFRIMQGRRAVATLVTGEGNMPGAGNAGCFVAVVQGRDTALIPTIGHANYEAQACSGVQAVGLLSTSGSIKFGFMFHGFTPSAQGLEPIVVDWDRSDNTLLIDDALSTKASLAGAQTIAAMRKLL